MKRFLIPTLAAIAFSQNAVAADPAFNVAASSGDVVSVWAKALDSHCDLSRGQTFTDTVTRIQ